MAKLYVMKRINRDTLIQKFMDILQNILEDVFTKEFMWEKILRFQTKTE